MGILLIIGKDIKLFEENEGKFDLKNSDKNSQSGVKNLLREFVAERDWGQFHTEENLAKSISIEAAELLEEFQWGATSDRQNVRMELADVLTYCYMLADKLGEDPEELIREKLEVTKKKYPVDVAKGSSKKYNK